ncbi:hypothetical protein Ct9H90mP29_19840 [bacterium]|nr:MAG: hypothetical protein Ct9H90mP29_19840 [bacterium]
MLMEKKLSMHLSSYDDFREEIFIYFKIRVYLSLLIFSKFFDFMKLTIHILPICYYCFLHACRRNNEKADIQQYIYFFSRENSIVQDTF